MAEVSTIARPYALAAFKQAMEEDKLGEWSEMLRLLATIVSDPLMKGIIVNPRVKREQLADLIIDVGGKGFTDTGKNFVRVLAEKNRLSFVPKVLEIFEQKRADSEGRSQVEVTTAFELDDGQRKQITGIMAKRLGTEIDLSERVDDSLIGGVIIRAGDLVIDASLRGRMHRLASSLL